MKKLLAIWVLLLVINNIYSQCDAVKTNLSTHIKKDLLAPTSFKIHRYSCEQISPPAQKLLADLKKLKIKYENQYQIVSQERDSVMAHYSRLKKIIDSLDIQLHNSPNYIERTNLQNKIKALNVPVPRDQEFINWMGKSGIDTTKAHLAFNYSNQLKKIPIDSIVYVYNDYSNRLSLVSKDLDRSNNGLNLITAKEELIQAYIESTKELPIYKAYIVYQALTKGGQTTLDEENYYFNKSLKCLGQEYDIFWENLYLLE